MESAYLVAVMPAKDANGMLISPSFPHPDSVCRRHSNDSPISPVAVSVAYCGHSAAAEMASLNS